MRTKQIQDGFEIAIRHNEGAQTELTQHDDERAAQIDRLNVRLSTIVQEQGETVKKLERRLDDVQKEYDGQVRKLSGQISELCHTVHTVQSIPANRRGAPPGAQAAAAQGCS